MKKSSAYILFSAVLIVLVGCAATAPRASTPLMQAIERGDSNSVRALLDNGMDISEQGDGEYPINHAAYYGHTEIVRLLLDRGANVNQLYALHTAAYHGHINTVRLLLDRGASTETRTYLMDSSGATPLTFAAVGGHKDIAKLLIDKGADIDAAIAPLEDQVGAFINPHRDTHRAALKMLQRLAEERKIVSQPQAPSPGISKEDLKTIVQAAIEGATKAQKQETKTAVKTDIDSPSFSPSQIVMGENDLAVIIGIEGYQGIPKSDYSYDDAKLVGDYAKALGFKPRNIELLLDERATKSAIEKIIKTWLPNKAKPDSRVFIYYSGHGAPEPRTGDAYLVPYDGDPNYLPDTGYPIKRLYESLGKLQVAEVTVVLDSCFSGAGGRSVLAKGARPLVMTTDISVLSSNMAVLSATQGTQISTSSPEKGHGIFTYYFLKALKEGKKDIAEIYSYIKPLVEDEAKQLNVQQSPSINPDGEKIKGRFELRK